MVLITCDKGCRYQISSCDPRTTFAKYFVRTRTRKHAYNKRLEKSKRRQLEQFIFAVKFDKCDCSELKVEQAAVNCKILEQLTWHFLRFIIIPSWRHPVVPSSQLCCLFVNRVLYYLQPVKQLVSINCKTINCREGRFNQVLLHF